MEANHVKLEVTCLIIEIDAVKALYTCPDCKTFFIMITFVITQKQREKKVNRTLVKKQTNKKKCERSNCFFKDGINLLHDTFL